MGEAQLHFMLACALHVVPLFHTPAFSAEECVVLCRRHLDGSEGSLIPADGFSGTAGLCTPYGCDDPQLPNPRCLSDWTFAQRA